MLGRDVSSCCRLGGQLHTGVQREEVYWIRVGGWKGSALKDVPLPEKMIARYPERSVHEVWRNVMTMDEKQVKLKEKFRCQGFQTVYKIDSTLEYRL